MSSIKRRVPVMDFPVRVETDENPGWKWDTLTYDQIFAGKKVIVFGFMGFSFSDYFHIILWMIISGFIGTYIGKKVLIKFGQKYFKIFLNSILTIISIHLILNGFLNYDFTFSS